MVLELDNSVRNELPLGIPHQADSKSRRRGSQIFT